jgi:glycosyltransferase involved in cell wall biosynthesis
MNLELSVIVPLYNEKSIVKELNKRLNQTLLRMQISYEIILIDDGSDDETWYEILSAAEENEYITGIKLTKNFGQHHAITAGIAQARGNWAVIMDGDLQDEPEVIPKLYEKALEGFDIVFVSRIKRKEKYLYKLAQRFFYFSLKSLSNIDFESRQANFSIISRKVIKSYLKFSEQSRFYGSTIKWLGYKRSSIEAEQGFRYSGKPSYTLLKRIKLASDVILSFSSKPLTLIISLGFAISVSSILVMAWVVFRSFNNGFSVMGWPSIIFSIYLIGGILLIVLGIIGLYIAKIFEQVKSRPLYLIENIFDRDKNSN